MVAHAGTILVITGVLTAGVGLGVFAPGRLLEILLGIEVAGAMTKLLGRYCFVLVALVGGLLIYAGYHAEIRVPAIVVGTVEKLTFVGLVLASPLRRRALTMFFVSADSVMALLFVVLLVRTAT